MQKMVQAAIAHRERTTLGENAMTTWMKASLLAALTATFMASPALAADVTSIAILTPEEGTDFGWNQQGVDAARAAAEAAGIEVIVASGLGYGDVRPAMREIAADGASLIIAHASGYATSAPEIAAETKVPVAIVDSPQALEEGLVADYTLSGHEGAYLAGRLAAKMSKAGHVGVVVSGEPPSWNAHSAGFAQGVRAENAQVKITYAVIGPAAYSDAAGGRRVTESVIAAGADIIFGQGNGSSFGMLQAVETARTVDGGKVLFIDVIGDKTSVAKGFLLSSVVWDITPVYSAMIKDLKDDTFGTKRYAIGLADDSVKLLKTDQIPEDVWGEVQKIREQMIAGEITVEPTFEATAVRALMTDISATAP
jgi:basic membrane protein A and related proteins